MASVRLDPKHQSVLDLLITSSRVASTAGRARTGPFNEMRQVVVFAASLGATAGRRRPIVNVGTTVRDSIMWEATGALELAFALAYRDSEWDLSVVADGAVADDIRLRALEEYAAGGFDLLLESYEALGSNSSAADLLLHMNKQAPPRGTMPAPTELQEPGEDPLIAALRRRGKLSPGQQKRG